MKTKRWQDWLNLLLGAWLVASPWVLNYKESLPGAARNAWIAGSAIAILAVAALSIPKSWEEVLNFILGAWVLASPWVLGFSTDNAAVLNAAIVGLSVMFLAAWNLPADFHFKDRWYARKRVM